MGDIGKEISTVEFEPIPDDIPVPEIVPGQIPESVPAAPPPGVAEPVPA